MKSTPKILTALFLLIFICQMIGLIILLALPSLSQAEEKKPIEFKPQITIGSFIAGEGKTINQNSIGEYIQSIYKYGIGIVGILAAVVLMMGGVIWLTAGGNQTRVGEAKAWIGASLTGLIIALTSYMILATVNPALVQFQPIEMAPVEKEISDDAGVVTNETICCLKEDNKGYETTNCDKNCDCKNIILDECVKLYSEGYDNKGYYKCNETGTETMPWTCTTKLNK